jgi:predicted ATPase
MLVSRAYVGAAPTDTNAWPYTVPCVASLVESGLTFERPVTFLVGENGSGKSTLVEAIAEAYRLDSWGGRAGRKYVNDRPKTPLGERLRLDLTTEGRRALTGNRRHHKGYFLRAETAFGFMATVQGMPGYWDDDTGAMSHGEGFLTVFGNMFTDRGLYLMDEPESALSFTSCLSLVRLMHELGESGSQVVCATHSPILASVPGADIVEVNERGFERTTWEDLQLVDHWRRYLSDPSTYLRHVLPDMA